MLSWMKLISLFCKKKKEIALNFFSCNFVAPKDEVSKVLFYQQRWIMLKILIFYVIK